MVDNKYIKMDIEVIKGELDQLKSELQVTETAHKNLTGLLDMLDKQLTTSEDQLKKEYQKGYEHGYDNGKEDSKILETVITKSSYLEYEPHDFEIGDKFTDINSNKKDEMFTVFRVDSQYIYDQFGKVRLSKNCKKI
jgi:hypothetical protein